MSNLFVVGYASPDLSKRLVDFAADRARLAGASLHLVHVIEWSPYSFETPAALAERHAVRDREMMQAETLLAGAVASLSASGVPVTTQAVFGHVATVLCDIAHERDACQIFVGRSGGSPLAARIVGSVALTLVQAAPVPVTVVP